MWVVLELLKGLEGFEPRILVIQADHEADVHAIVVEVIEKAAAVGAVVERPPDRVLNEAGLHAIGRQLPELLESQAVGLRRLARIELEALDQLLRCTAAAALAKHGHLRVDLGTQRKVGPGLTALFQPHVADAYALDGAAVIEECLGGRKTGEHIHTELFRLRAQNRHQLAERDDEIAVILHLRRSDRELVALGTGHHEEFVARCGHADRGRVLAPLRQQLIERSRLEDRARQGVRSEARGLFEHAHAQRWLQLFEPDGAGEPGRAGADDRDLILHDITLVFGHRIHT